MTDQAQPPAEAAGQSGKMSIWGLLFGTWPGRIVVLAMFFAIFAVAEDLVWIAFAAGLGGIMTMGAIQYFQAARRIADVPVSKIRSAAQGYVELIGHAATADGDPLTSPMTETPCHYWSLAVEVGRQGGDGLKWVSIASASSNDHFLPMEDDTGRCYVILDDPDVRSSGSFMDITRFTSLTPYLHLFPDLRREHVEGRDRVRLTEKIMPADKPLFATGLFRTIRSNTLRLMRTGPPTPWPRVRGRPVSSGRWPGRHGRCPPPSANRLTPCGTRECASLRGSRRTSP